MTDPDTISADYTIHPAELAEALSLLARSRQPVIVWSPPGCGKSQIAQQVANEDGYRYVDIRALLLDPVDLRGIPWRDEHGRTRWAPPSFLPPTDSTDALAPQSGGVGLLRAHGSGGPLPAHPGTEVRRVHAARGRLDHRLQQPRERPRRRPPHADAARQPLRPSRAPRRTSRTGWPGARRTESLPRSCSSSSTTKTCCTSSIPSRARKRSRRPAAGR